MIPAVLSSRQADILLQARAERPVAIAVSLDLGLTTSQVTVASKSVRLPDVQRLTWDDLETIWASPPNCFAITENTPQKNRPSPRRRSVSVA